MPTESLYPPINIPQVDIWAALFERKDKKGYPDDKVIYVDADNGRTLTYAQVKQTAEDFGKGLKSAWEWEKGDVLALYTPNHIDMPPLIWGVHWAGGVVSPSNFGYTVDELTYQLRDSGAKAIATQLDQLPTALEAAAKVGIPADRVILLGDKRDPAAKTKHFTSIRLTGGASRWRRTKRRPDELAFLVYSSGTTGLPKGVMLTHGNIVANMHQLFVGEEGHFDAEGRRVGGQLTPDGGPDGNGDCILTFLPFFHIYGLDCILHQAIFAGLRTVVMPRFDIERWCALVAEHRATFSYIVPPVILLLAKHPAVERHDLSSLRMLNSGAAPLTRELVEACYARIRVPVKQGYGLSETSPTTHTQPWRTWRTNVGSVGRMVPNLQARYVGEDGADVATGEVGELWVRGPNVFAGYLNNAEGTRSALTPDGWFRTGDVGYQDGEGNFYITDRVKELIKYKGFQVPPAELEGLLASSALIDDVAVVGVYDREQATELPLAFVVPAKGVEAGKRTEKEITDWLASKVANHKKLRGGVRFVDAIPKSASGKILRRLLKAKIAEEEKKGQKAKL